MEIVNDMKREINIAGIDKLELFTALYNSAQHAKFFKREIKNLDFITEYQAQVFNTYSKGTFDFILLGEEPFGVDLGTDQFDPVMYDHLYGKGKAEQVINRVKEAMRPNIQAPEFLQSNESSHGIEPQGDYNEYNYNTALLADCAKSCFEEANL